MLDIVDSIVLNPNVAGGWTNWSPLDDRWYAPRLPESTAGVEVDEDLAMTYQAVFACVAKISIVDGFTAHFLLRSAPDQQDVCHTKAEYIRAH